MIIVKFCKIDLQSLHSNQCHLYLYSFDNKEDEWFDQYMKSDIYQ